MKLFNMINIRLLALERISIRSYNSVSNCGTQKFVGKKTNSIFVLFLKKKNRAEPFSHLV